MTNANVENKEMYWSEDTRHAIAAATKGQSLSGKERTFVAWRFMQRDLEHQIGAEFTAALTESWNAYLERNAPAMIESDHRLELAGMLILIGDYPATVDHDRVAHAVRSKLGAAGEARYRRHVTNFFARIDQGAVLLADDPTGRPV